MKRLFCIVLTLLFMTAGLAGAAEFINGIEQGGGSSGSHFGAVDPDANFDANDGVSVGDNYVNTTSDATFTCADNTPAAAVWNDTGAAAVGAVAEDINDAWATLLSGTQTLITVTYQDATDDADFVVEDDLNLYSWTNVDATDLKVGSVTQAYDADLTTYAGITPSANVQALLAAADYAAFKALIDTDDIQTSLGIAAGAVNFGSFTGATITANQALKPILQELETAVDAAGAADAFTLKVDAAATAGYLGAASSDGILRTGTGLVYADGGDFVTITPHAYLVDIAGLTLAQGDVFYFDGTDIANLGPGIAGQFLKTGGAAANPSWDDPAGSGDITAVGDSLSGGAFTADGSGNALYFEGTTANTYEIALTGANPVADVIVTIPATTGTLLLEAGTGTSLTALNGENIQDDTIDDDSIDWSDVTAADITMTDAGVITASGLITASAGVTVATGQAVTVGVVQWDNGSDAIDGEIIADNTIDDDSIDLTDFTLADITFDVGSVSTTEFGYLDGVTGALQGQIDGKEGTLTDSAGLLAALDDETGTGVAVFGTNPTLTGVTMAGDIVIGANQITSTGDVDIKLGDATGTYSLKVYDSADTLVWWVDSDGVTGTPAANEPYYKWDENDGVDYYIGIYDTTTDRLEIRRSATVNTNVDAYFDADGAYVGGNVNLAAGHTFQVDGTQIALSDLSDGESHTANHILGGADEIDGDLLDIDYAETNYTPATTGVATNVNHLAAHLEGIDDALGAISGSNLAGLTDTTDVDYTAGTILIGDGVNSFDEKTVSGVISLAGSGATAFADGDRGDITASGGNFTLDADVVAAAEMADADHGDVAWSSGVVTVQAVSGANAVDSDAYVDGSIDAAHLAVDVIDEGKIADDGIDSEHYNDGSIDSVHINSYSDSTVLAEPDELQGISDAWLVKYFPAETYPSGVTIDAIHITTSATCTDALNFEEWTQSGTASSSTVEAITLSGTFTEDDGTLTDGSIAADGRLMVDLPATPTDIAFYEITVIYHAN